MERPLLPCRSPRTRTPSGCWHEKNALRSVGMFDRAGRAAARLSAAQAAQAELDDRWRRAQAEQAGTQ